MTDNWFLPPARTQFRPWHGLLLVVSVAVPMIVAAWYAQRKSRNQMARHGELTTDHTDRTDEVKSNPHGMPKTSVSSALSVVKRLFGKNKSLADRSPKTSAIGAIRGKTDSSAVLRVFWIVAVLVGLEVIYDGWFIAVELARLDRRALPDAVTATAPVARLVLGFHGGLALLGGARPLDLKDTEQSTQFLFRLLACAIVLGATAWSRASVPELMLLMGVVMFAAHWLRGFAAEPTPRRAWQALGMLAVSALLFWAVTKYSRVGNLYVFQLARGQKVQAIDVEFQMRAR